MSDKKDTLHRDGDAVWAKRREKFEENFKLLDNAILKFDPVPEGNDVYNCSIPFIYNGEKYIFGRIEPHTKWSCSHIRLFKETAPDSYTFADGSNHYTLEDPFIAIINDELIFGGVNVKKIRGQLDSYETRFYKGKSPFELEYFTTGPRNMKDIRLVQLPDGIGVFTRPAGYVGFTVIKDVMELDDKVIEEAPLIDFIADGSYGGVNQCYYLESGMIGLIGHLVYPKTNDSGKLERVYVNTAAIFDPNLRKTIEHKIIGTRRSYPASSHMRTDDKGNALDDTAFTTGIVMREDGKVDLYSGLSDALEGRTVIDYPFEGYGKIVYGLNTLK